MRSYRLNRNVRRRGQVEAPADGETLGSALPSRLVETVLRELGAWIGPERGEKLVGALHTYLEEQPGLARILATPGLVQRADFKPALDALVEHVRKQQNI